MIKEPLKFPFSKLAKLVTQAREARGWSQEDLAFRVGVVQQAISKIEDGTTVSPTSWKEVADALGIDHETFKRTAVESKQDKRTYYSGYSDEEIAAEIHNRSSGFQPSITPGEKLVGDRNFPIYAAAMGGDGHQIVTFDAIDYVKRPSILENVKGAYGLYIVGESMFPAFDHGDMALIHPHLPFARETNVVLYHVPPTGEGDVEAIVKRLHRFNDREWILRQYNPAREFSESRADWTCCHRIVGKYEAR